MASEKISMLNENSMVSIKVIVRFFICPEITKKENISVTVDFMLILYV